MTDPDDTQLLEFIARFAGLKDLRETQSGFLLHDFHGKDYWQHVPDYISSVDAWLRDVWPKVLSAMRHDDELVNRWVRHLNDLDGSTKARVINADARSRCLALWRALDGQFPEDEK